jgi:hypothetical protein
MRRKRLFVVHEHNGQSQAGESSLSPKTSRQAKRRDKAPDSKLRRPPRLARALLKDATSSLSLEYDEAKFGTEKGGPGPARRRGKRNSAAAICWENHQKRLLFGTREAGFPAR